MAAPAPAPVAPSRVRYEHTSDSAESLIELLTTDILEIAVHQRAFVWPVDHQRKMVETVQRGLPTANILIRKERNRVQTLEDGQQRLTCLRRYFNDEFVDKQGRKFSDLPIELKLQMKNYMFGITRYWNATDSDAIKIFDYQQNGVPLSVGDRLHALTAISPIVQFTNELVLSPASEFASRATAVWGSHDGTTKKRNELVKAFSIACGCAFGPAFITRKWGEIRDLCIEGDSGRGLLTDDAFDRGRARRRYDALLRVYEGAQARQPANKAYLKKQWNAGLFTGPILWSFEHFGEGETERLVEAWGTFLANVRRDPDLLGRTLNNPRYTGKARSWNERRWMLGYYSAFDIAEAERILDAAGAGSEDSEETEDED
jgi:hypothetical protein